MAILSRNGGSGHNGSVPVVSAGYIGIAALRADWMRVAELVAECTLLLRAVLLPVAELPTQLAHPLNRALFGRLIGSGAELTGRAIRLERTVLFLVACLPAGLALGVDDTVVSLVAPLAAEGADVAICFAVLRTPADVASRHMWPRTAPRGVVELLTVAAF
jgi:hypothetical protein